MSETSGSGFAPFVPGFEFLQSLASQTSGGGLQGAGSGVPQLPNLGHWVAPTFQVEDLEKRIEELKAVQFWLDQNAKALAATIQALEVQKMTLATLKSMNVSLGEVTRSFQMKDADTGSSNPEPTPSKGFAGLEIPPRTYGANAPATSPTDAEAPARTEPDPRKATAQSPTAASPAGGVVDPLQWWGALTQQFQRIAATAMQEASTQGQQGAPHPPNADTPSSGVSPATATSANSAARARAPKATTPKSGASKKSAKPGR
jgi:hypothetical protein